jgi:hypothetical protein
MDANARRAVAASVLSLLGIVPHAIDDFVHGGPDRFGVPPVAFMWSFGVFAAGVAAAAAWAATGSRKGLRMVFAVGIVWALTAAGDHWQAFLSATFRESFASRLWVWLIVAFQGLAAVFAWRGLRTRPG